MTYFVNAFQLANGLSGKSLSYMLFSAESLDALRKLIIKELEDSWYGFLVEQDDDLSGIENLESFDDIGNRFKQAMQNYIKGNHPDLREYDLHIFSYDTKIEDAFKFYNRYSTLKPDVNEHIDYYFYGEYYEKIQDVFPYFSKLYKDYKIKITRDTLLKYSDLIQ
jgi:hypothetical protein